MRSEKQLLVASRAFAQERTSTSWWVLGSTLLAYFASLAVCLTDWSLWVRVPASLLGGLVIVRMFIIYHDYQHHAILVRSRVANAVLSLYGMLVLSPPSVWNRSHNHHHKHNSKELGSSVGSFPTMTCEQYEQASWSARVQYVVSRHPLTILLGYLTVFMYGMCVQALLRKPRQHLDAVAALLLHVAMVAGLIELGWDKLWLCLVVPMSLACCLGSYLFYAQHNFPTCRLESRGGWSHSAAALGSSSYLKMGRLMNWFTGNIGLHHIHHLNAKIPFYRLPEAMAQLPELQKPASTTLFPSDVYACFQANLWDDTQQRFVSYQEAAQRP